MDATRATDYEWWHLAVFLTLLALAYGLGFEKGMDFPTRCSPEVILSDRG